MDCILPSKSLSLLLFLLLFGNISGGWYGNFSDYRPFRIRTTRFICSGNETNHHVAIHECNLKLLRNGSSVINFNATILQPVQPVWVSIKHMYKTNAHVYHPMLGIDGTLELCQYLAQGTGGNAFSEAVRKMATRFVPHLLKPCPIVGEYSVTNFIYEESMFPPFLPAGDWKNNIRFFHMNNETLFNIQFYGSVRAKGVVDLSLG